MDLPATITLRAPLTQTLVRALTTAGAVTPVDPTHGSSSPTVVWSGLREVRVHPLVNEGIRFSIRDLAS